MKYKKYQNLPSLAISESSKQFSISIMINLIFMQSFQLHFNDFQYALHIYQTLSGNALKKLFSTFSNIILHPLIAFLERKKISCKPLKNFAKFLL